MKFGFPRKHTFARKILIVFFISSFIPVTGISILSQDYVSDIVKQEVHRNLIKSAKSYGLHTYDRLTILRKKLDSISLAIDERIPPYLSSLFNEFDRLELIERYDYLANENGMSDKTVLSTYNDRNGHLFIRIDKPHTAKNGKQFLLGGSTRSEYIWGDKETNIFNESVCIFEESGKRLFCSKEDDQVRESLSSLSSSLSSKERIIDLPQSDNKMLAVSWELFLPTYFESDSWFFVVLKSKRSAFATTVLYQSIIIPVSFLFFFTIAYLLLKVTERLLRPLSSLAKATQRVAKGDFNINLDVNTKDEFEDLSHAFNGMAMNLDNQFSKTKAFSKLEQYALETLDIHYAVKKALPGILRTVKSQWLVISIKDPSCSDAFTTHCLSNSTAQHSNTDYSCLKHKINPKRLRQDYGSLNRHSFKEVFSSLSEKVNTPYQWVKTVKIDSKIACYIVIGDDNKKFMDEATLAVVEELAERIAIIYTSYKQKSALYKKAHIDELTGLPNRYHLLLELKKSWLHATERNSKLAVLFIDLDHFKKVNDLSGHRVGNEVLKQVANRIEKCADKNSIVARLSGDEFCIVMHSLKHAEHAQNIAGKIIHTFKSPFAVNGMSYFLGLSVGVSIGPGECRAPEQLLERADLAMFTAKEQGRNQFVLYDDKIEDDRSLRLSLERDLHFALERNEIGIMYQPKIDLETGHLHSVEALARWNHREIGAVQTDYFISIAEDSGLIHVIGERILTKACYQFVDWMQKGIPIDSIAVNVSAHQLAMKNFPSIVQSVLELTQIPANCLEIEVTESAFIRDEYVLIKELSALHDLGIAISIDDFGKEYSSLSYLKKIPFDTLKIDREFVIDIETSDHDKQIVDVIINIGHVLKKKIVAEGIETLGQRKVLKDLRCDYGQGYLFSHPLSEIEFLEFAVKYTNDGMETRMLSILPNKETQSH